MFIEKMAASYLYTNCDQILDFKRRRFILRKYTSADIRLTRIGKMIFNMIIEIFHLD